MRVRDRVNPLLPVDPRETRLDAQSALLIENIRSTLKKDEMFRRILGTRPKPSVLLAELLEDTGNRYIDFSELVTAASAGDPRKSKSKQRACALRRSSGTRKEMPSPSVIPRRTDPSASSFSARRSLAMENGR